MRVVTSLTISALVAASVGILLFSGIGERGRDDGLRRSEIAAGPSHSCRLLPDGGVSCAGTLTSRDCEAKEPENVVCQVLNLRK